MPRSLWLWLRWGDLSSVPLLRAEGAAAITVQKAIDGLPANCAFAAWRGKLLACISVEALETQTPTGVATVIRVRDAPAMENAARKVVAQLGLSGLHGLDFILARDTGAPWLIEINGRPTQTAYLRLGAGADSRRCLLCHCNRPTRADGRGFQTWPGHSVIRAAGRYTATATGRFGARHRKSGAGFTDSRFGFSGKLGHGVDLECEQQNGASADQAPHEGSASPKRR